MNTIFAKLHSDRGFSLLEVLIALTLTGVITAAIMQAYVTQHKNYMVQDDITAVQQSARAAIDEVGRHVRMAGNNLPAGVPALTPVNSNPDSLLITYRVDDCEAELDTSMASVNDDIRCADPVDCFEAGEMAYIFHPDSGGGEWFWITDVDSANNRLSHALAPLSQAYADGAVVMTMEQILFYVDTLTDPDHPRMMIQLPQQVPQIYADNVSDLQFRYRLENGSVVDSPALIEDVREVLISVTGRSENPDPDDEDDDPYRRRTYSSSVNLRNIGL
ncbi:prepilin-type N-terminal cleavage/methylation domain-containing protein [candidate division GN15 bacterium]|nr:prepilin-type N-terminal cleavage/methylation domain-containing protein [candidate division GN15 bacterium]